MSLDHARQAIMSLGDQRTILPPGGYGVATGEVVSDGQRKGNPVGYAITPDHDRPSGA